MVENSIEQVGYLLDTNIISEPTRLQPDLGVMDKLSYLSDACGLSAVTLHELRFGWLRMPEGAKKQAIGSYISQVVAQYPCFGYDAKAARVHAEIRTYCQKNGFALPFVDGQIAAIAIANGFVLVTRNLKDFKGIEGLRLENWFTGLV